MEASQASEAGSIPVARSTPARPRAGRFCYSCAGCARTTEIRRTSSTRGNPAHTDGCDTVQRGKCTTRGSDTAATGCRTASRGAPTTADVESASSPTRPGCSASRRENTRPARPLQRPFREKVRPAQPLQRLFREKTRPAQPLQQPFQEKFAQHGPSSGLSAKKFAQQAQKRRIWGVLSAQGELFRAFAMTQGRGANFFAPK